MIYNFQLASNKDQYAIDVEALTWAKTSNILAAPTIIAAEANIARFIPQEEGRLTPLGGGRYALDGRRPFDAKGIPQLALFMVVTVLSSDNEGTCMTFLQSNVALENFQHQNIKNFESRCLPPMQLENKS